MAQQDSSTSVPVVEFDPRTGKSLFPAQYYKDTEQQYKDYDTGDKQAIGKNAPTSTGNIRRGAWLSNKLQTLYNDPKFKSATPEQQKEWKGLAYDKWVQPYYKKVLGANAPEKEEWLTKQFNNYNVGTGVKDIPIQGVYKKIGQETLGHVAKATTEITSGLLHNLADGLDFIDQHFNKPEEGKTQGIDKIRAAGDKYAKLSEGADTYLESIHNVQHGEKPKLKDDIPGKITELGTQAVFFEATGAAKAAKVFSIVNPKTAALAYQMAKASWNGALDYGLWSTSQGDKPKEVLENAATGGALGPLAKLAQRKALDPLVGVLSNLFKWGGSSVVKAVTEDVLNSPKKSEETIQQALSPLTQQGKQASAFTRVALDNYSKAKFNKTFDQLGYIQRQHVLTKMLTSAAEGASKASAEGMPKQLIQAQAKEEDARIAEIFPEAKTSQAKIEEFVKANGEPPVQTKLLASLPHHNTTVESPWKHIQARTSFLKSQLRRYSPDSTEYKNIQEALNEEYSMMKEKAAKQVRTKETSGGTVGGAAANDPRAFRSDYVVTPNIDPYNTGFGEWKTDTFAQGVAQLARQQAAAKGSARSFITDAIDNATMVGANLSKKAFLQEGVTKQLFHPEYGLVGGINWQLEKAYNLGENSGFKGSDPLLFINWLGMRPNVVARVWPVKGGGQTLFLNAAMEAERTGAGIALIPYDASKSFYEKMGMREVGSYMAMTHKEVQNLLRDKGLLMMLLGAGITYGVGKNVLSEGDFSVRGKN